MPPSEIDRMRSLVAMTDDAGRLGDAHGEWYYCFTHQKVEHAGECTEMDRMGPYPTAEDARDWKARVEERNREWDEEEEE